VKQIASAFIKAQKEFAPALKTNSNPFFKSKYADLSVCIEAVIDGLHNNGIALIQRNHDCNDGVKVETILLHESGEEFSGGILHVPALKSDPQAYGSALTYARRYSLMATCGIAAEDDDGNAATRPVKTSPAPNLKPPALSIDEVNNCLNAMIGCDDFDALKGIYGGAYKRANADQQAILSETYNIQKSLLTKAA
jgi:ERF superfamily